MILLFIYIFLAKILFPVTVAEAQPQSQGVLCQNQGTTLNSATFVNAGSGLTATWANGVCTLTGAGGGGTVTSIATTSPITGGPITTTGTIACPTCLTNVTPTAASGTFLSSGGTVAWVSGLTFTVGAANYYIAGTNYTSTQQNVTLAAADPTNARIDAITLDTTGTVSKITGTPGAPPFAPSVDPNTLLAVTFVLVQAGATTPGGVSTTMIYDEGAGGEWTATSNSANIVVGSTNNPHTGTKDIEGTNAVAGNQVTFVKPSGSVDLSTQSTFVFYVRLKAAFPNPKRIRVFWQLGAATRGQPIDVADGSYGFTGATTGTYQQVVIPTSQFAVPAGSGVDTVIMQIVGGGASVGFYWDTIQLQVGTGLGTVTVPGGANQAVQYNNNGAFGGFGSFTSTSNLLTLPGSLTLPTASSLTVGSNQLVGAVTDKLNAGMLAIASQAVGDLLVANATTTFTRLGIGTAGQVLSSTGTTASWQTLANQLGPGTGNGGLIGGGAPSNDNIGALCWWQNVSVNCSVTQLPLLGWIRNIGVVTNNSTTQPANVTNALYFADGMIRNTVADGLVLLQSTGTSTSVGTWSSGQDTTVAVRMNRRSEPRYNYVRGFGGTTAGALPTGWAAEFLADDGGMVMGRGEGGATVALSTTTFSSPWGSTVAQATAAAANVPMPIAGTLKNFCACTSGTQPANNSLVATVMVNSVATSIVATINASSTAGCVCDTTHTASINANDEVCIRWVNNANATSAARDGWVLELLPSGTTFAVGGSNLGSIATNVTTFSQVFVGTVNTTEAAIRLPVPRAGTTSKLCIDLSAASAQTITATIMKNGSATGLAVTSTANTTGVTCGTSGGPVSWAQGDQMSVRFVQQNGGGASTVSGWSFDFQ